MAQQSQPSLNEETESNSAVSDQILPPLISKESRTTLFRALGMASQTFGPSTVIAEDPLLGALSYRSLIRSALTIGRVLAKATAKQDYVGLLMPTSCAGLIAFFGIHSSGRVPVLLHVQAGAAALKAAVKIAGLEAILTSRAFVEKAQLSRVISQLEEVAEIIYIEDLRSKISTFDKVITFVRSYRPFRSLTAPRPDAPAAILFTSGTTGEPKAVMLSHANILANIAQIRAHLSFDPNWVFFNVLPTSHAFGLTGGTLLPILSGMKAILHPAPLDRNAIVRALRESRASVLVATDSFAQLYARTAKKADLHDLEYIVLGGERLTEPTVRLLSQKSTAEIIQGYGATECSPVISMNRPQANVIGTVGSLLPGIEMRLEPVKGIPSGANLFVRGPNVMRGYLTPDGQRNVEPLPDGWFDTGDIVGIDADGFITIIDRRKRFAKLGAEMVSLEAVEACARAVWPKAKHAAIAVAEAAGRDSITLVTEHSAPNKQDLREWVKNHDLPPKTVPQRIVGLKPIPLLPTGKIDYLGLRRSLAGRSNQTNGSGASEESDKACST